MPVPEGRGGILTLLLGRANIRSHADRLAPKLPIHSPPGPKNPICRPTGPKISNMPPAWAQNFQYAAYLGSKFPKHCLDHIKYADHLSLNNIGPPK